MNDERSRPSSSGRARPGRKGSTSHTVRLEIAARLDLLEVVQTLLAHLAGNAGFDEDALHYMSVAVRESVVNAIKHGSQGDESKRVTVTFAVDAEKLAIEVGDEGDGFDPSKVADPLAEENLLKPYGRGIFFMRSFMDDVSYSFRRGGGTVVRMIKKRPSAA